MRPIPFQKLLKEAVGEFRQKGSFFYVPVEKIDHRIKKVSLSGKEVESPLGPAAGPHTQLAQNILAAYGAGARYFELKTVQILDGVGLNLRKPCIYVNMEAYNTEWSSELTSYQALEEYIKAWYLLKLLIKEFRLGDTDGFVFNMSVGYNLNGIRSDKIDYFIESMKDASEVKIYKDCRRTALENMGLFAHVTEEYIKSLDSCISNMVTLSTMHGCPGEEIESITTYLMEEKGLNTYLKCNPTLLGAKQARKILDRMGYGYIEFDEKIFDQDISFKKAVALIKRLRLVSMKNRLEFGIKLTNTFPVKIKNRELKGEDMYMSGPALYPLAIGVAARLSEALDGKILISYSGGADTNNIGAIYETGICPITVSTILLKTGGYKNLAKLNRVLAEHQPDRLRDIQTDKMIKLAEKASYDKNYFKALNKLKGIRDTEYSPCCSRCRNCVDVCPNRANVLYERNHKKYTIHQDALCNECGNCSHFCILGHDPYREKFTLFQTKEDFFDSSNDGFYRDGGYLYVRRMERIYKKKAEAAEPLPEDIIEIVDFIEKEIIKL